MINITSKGDELLETRLNEATNPLNPSLNIAAMEAFCEQVLKEPEGCQIAVRLLAHKVQSPQEKEALYSFAVIDECVKKCGPRFHQEVGKFRFLNELIKVISPKYLALTMSSAVKKRCIECLYGLYKGIPHESKLSEAYNMLKKQHIITQDPTYLDDKIFKVSLSGTERTKSIFETSKDSERLAKLLKSRNPDDLKEANRIIKNVVQADNNRIEQLSKRQIELETMRNNIELLGEMITHYRPGEGNPDDLFIMKELVENLEKSRSEMFKLSRETDDDDSLNEIIKVIEECNRIIKRYWDVMAGNEQQQKEAVRTNITATEGDLIGDGDLLGESLSCDLLASDLQNIGIHDNNVSVGGVSAPATKYDELMDLFPGQIKYRWFNSGEVLAPINDLAKSNHVSESGSQTMGNGNTRHQNNIPNKTSRIEYKGFEDLDVLSKELFNLNKKNISDNEKEAMTLDVDLLSSLEDKKTSKDSNISGSDLPLLICSNLGPQHPVTNPTDISIQSGDCPLPKSSALEKAEIPNVDLNTFDINLSSIRPHPLKIPVVIYKSSESLVKVTLYFASDRPHPNVVVMVAQISSENSYPVTDIVLKFAVSKPLRVRKIPGSCSRLPAHSPFTPSTPINEVVLLFNPSSDAVDLKYHLSYEVNGESFLESANTGSIDF